MKNKKRRGVFRTVFNSIVYFIIAVVLISVGFGFFTINKVIAESPHLDIQKINSYEPTKVLDSKENLVSVLGGEIRENVSYNDLPQTVIDAFLAVEDSRFEQHNGFDIPRFLKSFLVNVKSGGIQQGGSTITMQLIDNSYFNADQSKQTLIQKLKQKISEITMAMELEKHTSKKDILTAYLNKINFGDKIRGIGKASEYYFGKKVNQLSLSESAFLAGLINAPNLFNPYNGIVKEEDGTIVNYYEFATKRRDTTLDLMKLHGYITDTEYQLAKNTPLGFQLAGKKSFNVNDDYLAYTDIVVDEVMELTGKNPHTVSMTIYTALDKDTQDLSNRISSGEESMNFPQKDGLQIGAAVVDNVNHELVAINPGLGKYEGEDRRNFGYVEKNQIGSTSKPIVSYTPAFDVLNYSTGHTFMLKPLSFRGTNIPMVDFYPLNKPYSFEQAVAYSLNKTSLETFYRVWDKIGVDGYNELMKKLGVDVPEVTDQFSIGAGDFRLTPYELAGAYSAIASGGKYVKPTTIRKVIVHSTGEVFEPKKEVKQPYSPQAAYLMSTLLERAVNGGYANGLGRLASGNFTVYAKSGTSDWGKSGLQYGIPEGASRDMWIASFTGNTTVVAWAGQDTRKLSANSYFTLGELYMAAPHQIARKLLHNATGNRPNVEITRPEGIVNVRHIKGLYPYMVAPDFIPSGFVSIGLAKASIQDTLRSYQPQDIPTSSGFVISLNSEAKTIDYGYTITPTSELLGKATFTVVVKDASGKEIYKNESDKANGAIALNIMKEGVYTIVGSVRYENGDFGIPDVTYEYTHQIKKPQSTQSNNP